MFWSEQILVNRKSGVATVWLVATLGSRSGLKKITRKEILDVDVAKACKTIREPGAPMALRLQGSLMYGVVRVYSQQCEYVLSDVQGARDRMRGMLRAVRTAELDENAGKVRPDQLNLPYDPNFVLDASFFSLELLTPELTPDGSQRSSRLTPLSGPSSQHSQNSQQGQKSILGLDIGTSDSGGAGDIGGFVFPEAGASSAQKSNQLGVDQDDREGSFILDALFDFDEDGNVRELSPARDHPLPAPGANIPSQDDSAIDRRVRNEHKEGLMAGIDNGAVPMDIDDFQPILGDDLDLLQDLDFGEEVPAAQPEQPSTLSPDQLEYSETAEAPMKPRKKRTLEMDPTQEMRNSELSRMNTEYATNMQHQAAQRSLQKITTQAKKNAFFWVWSLGIGGVGQGIGVDHIRDPLHAFGGDELYLALTGEENIARKRKVSPVNDASTDSETRHKRAREEDAGQVGRGDGRGDDLIEDEGAVQFDDDGIEVGRNAPSALADISSLMPWNSGSIQGSRHGSSARGKLFIGSVGGFPSSAGGPSSLPGMDLPRRGRRLTSQSPLTGRGPVLERFSSVEPWQDGDGLGDPVLDEAGLGEEQDYDEAELYGPGANVNTQTAAQSQWMRTALDQESSNFFAFLRAEAGNKTGVGTGVASVTFEELLPSGEHSKIVAAQAFHHLLALATKAVITVRQEEAFGEIQVDIAVEERWMHGAEDSGDHEGGA